MFKVNEKCRDGELLSVWLMDGIIYVKILLDGRFIKIVELEDFENL